MFSFPGSSQCRSTVAGWRAAADIATSCTWMTLLAQSEFLVLFPCDNYNLKYYVLDLQIIQIINPQMRKINIHVEVRYF